MKSEDKIKKALNVLDEMCEKEKSLVNKFIVADMSKSLRTSFQSMQHTIDAQSNHVEERETILETKEIYFKASREVDEKQIAQLEKVVKAAENLTGQQLFGTKAFTKYWSELKEAVAELANNKDKG